MVIQQVYLQKQLELGLVVFAEKYGLVPIAGVQTDGKIHFAEKYCRHCMNEYLGQISVLEFVTWLHFYVSF